MHNSIVLVCAADDNYSMPLAATTRSVIASMRNPQNLSLYIIDGGISSANKQRIIQNLQSEQVKVTWIKARRSQFKNMQISSSVTIAAYYRLLIPAFLPNEIEKAIYIDSDVIVRSDIEALWNQDIGDNYLLAVQDMGAPLVSSARGLVNYQELGIPADCKYFNSGVLVLNLKKWRQENTSLAVIKYLNDYKQYVRWFDQDGLNAVLAGKWGELDARWNQMPYLFRFGSWQESPFSEEEYNNLREHAYIIHYSTREKPWNENCSHPQKELFYEYLDNSIWSNWYVEQAAKKRRQKQMAVFNNMYSSFKKQIKSLIPPTPLNKRG
ncbi:glycosyl transferase family 8 [Calothrix sp. NIES-4071]|nr:glycosyl transferase family 8 [Calothrix sp. NIES-4071]BAZ63068.1 glycosyl transferase family 8 [Calothrix sp. NIES-4105]